MRPTLKNKYILYFLLFLICAGAATAQEKKGFFSKIDSTFGLSSTKKIDTSYFYLSPYGWMVNINNNFSVTSVMAEREIGGAKNTLTTISNFNYAIGATVGYRNIILGYSFLKPVGKARDMSIGFAGNAWGVEFRRYMNEDMSGDFENNVLNTNTHIAEGDIRVETRYLRAYHVFSAQKFSLTAANDQRCIQRRSAGSLLFFTDFSRHGIDFLNANLSAALGGVERIQLETASFGFGYGYNYTPNQGRMLFHAAVVPMFAVIMNNCIFYPNDIDLVRATHIKLQWLGRFTFNYHFNDRFGLNVTAVYYNSSLSMNNSTKATWNDLTIKASLCFRI